MEQRHYENHCWSCKHPISSETCWQCPTCGWYICSVCGKCKEGCEEGSNGNERYSGIMRQKNMIRKQLSDEQALTPMVFAELNRAITETEVNAFAEKYAREIERSRCRAKEKQREKIIAEQANSHESKLNSIGYYKIVSVHSNFIRYHIAATETHGTIFKNPGKIPKVFNDPKTGEKYIFIDISRL